MRKNLILRLVYVYVYIYVKEIDRSDRLCNLIPTRFYNFLYSFWGPCWGGSREREREKGTPSVSHIFHTPFLF
jgi:hypothetical protein